MSVSFLAGSIPSRICLYKYLQSDHVDTTRRFSLYANAGLNSADTISELYRVGRVD